MSPLVPRLLSRCCISQISCNNRTVRDKSRLGTLNNDSIWHLGRKNDFWSLSTLMTIGKQIMNSDTISKQIPQPVAKVPPPRHIAPTINNPRLVHSVVNGANQLPVGPLEGFFTGFGEFEYRPNESASVQMKRLKVLMEKVYEMDEPETRQRKLRELKRNYDTALVRQFHLSYGKDEDDLAAWHKLLRHCGIEKLPKTSAACKRIVKSKYINLIDLEDARDDPTQIIKHFATEKELSKYTLSEDKVFPRDHIEGGTLLRYLLRDILEPGMRSYRTRDKTVK